MMVHGMGGNSYASPSDPTTVLNCPPCDSGDVVDVQAIIVQTLAATIVASVVSSVMSERRKRL